jgi:fluoride exporter
VSATTALLVALGAAVGAPARYLADELLAARVGRRFPWGTLAVNLLGSLVLGLLAGRAGDGGRGGHLFALAGTGFCGAFTTASTFAWEAVALAETGHWRRATTYVAASLLLGVALAALGYAVTAR